MEHLQRIAIFVCESFFHIWPWLLITIPFSVAIKLTDASHLISKMIRKKPWVSIILATLIGAFSPFCSCGVVPVISSLLISGVPLAPVMSFWIASPSMDPEIFFLSTASIGWSLSVWRLVATFMISLSAGFITHWLMNTGWIGEEVLRNNSENKALSWRKFIRGNRWIRITKQRTNQGELQPLYCCASSSPTQPKSCCTSAIQFDPPVTIAEQPSGNACREKSCTSETATSFKEKLVKETVSAVWMVVKFMALAFTINALIQFYLPADLLNHLLGKERGPFSVVAASLIGIPAYTTNLTALPLVSGLLSMGVNKGAALSFLIAGATTTLPAMAAVWGIAKRRVFLLYLSFSFFGALIFGLLYNLIH